ncbi:MAG: hypothetical protein ACP5OO_00415 [Chloroflexia bacterium]
MNLGLKQPIPKLSLASAILGLIIFIGVLLPWVTAGAYGFSGFQWGDGWLVFICALAAIGAGLEGMFVSGHVRTIASWVMFGAGAIGFLICLIDLFSVPGGAGPGAGLFICFFASILLAVVGAIPLYPLVIKRK